MSFRNWDMSWDMSKPRKEKHKRAKTNKDVWGPLLWNEQYKTISGLQTECRASMNPNEKTLSVLETLEIQGFCPFELDDSPDSYETIMQLGEISGVVGYDLIGYRSVSGEAVYLNSNADVDKSFGIHCYVIFNQDYVHIGIPQG